MDTLRHLVEPERLLLTWQPPEESAPSRTRRIVGELTRGTDGVSLEFRYLVDSPDYGRARELGFRGFPAFELEKNTVFGSGVLEAFLRRLPPRRREDFEDFLRQHWLPFPFPLSDFALLGYTGAKLPSDGFSLVPVFAPSNLPCEYVMEVAGTRYASGVDLAQVRVGDRLTLVLDDGNPVDADALLVCHRGLSIGYVNRALRSTVHAWLEAGLVDLTVARKNGRPDRPLIYCRVSAHC